MRSCSRPAFVQSLLVGAALLGGIGLPKTRAVHLQPGPDQGHNPRPDSRPRPATTEASLEAKVDRYLKPYLDTGNFSGSVLVARQGKIYLSKGYGYSNREQRVPNEARTVFHLASLSRIFTSAAILLLEQQGKLSVEDKLSKHLPNWPRGDEITIHHLLTLSAGFPNINAIPGYEAWSKSRQTPATLCEKFRDLPLEFPPGTKSVHSNSNYNVLALLIEKLSNRTYGEFLKQELFAPLGMAQTAHDDHSERSVSHEALGYKPMGLARMSKMATPDWSVKTGNGSIYSTTEDLYKFDRMLVEKALLNEASVAKLFMEHFPHNGYGWFVRKRFGRTAVSINGRSPGFGSSWLRSVGPDVTVIVLGNLYNGVPTQIGRDLLAMTLGDDDVDPISLSRETLDPSLLAAIVGAYQFGPEFYNPNAILSFHVQDGHLFDGDSDWMIPAGGMKFVHRVYWSGLEFRRDESGRVVELQYDSFVGIRKD